MTNPSADAGGAGVPVDESAAGTEGAAGAEGSGRIPTFEPSDLEEEAAEAEAASDPGAGAEPAAAEDEASTAVAEASAEEHDDAVDADEEASAADDEDATASITAAATDDTALIPRVVPERPTESTKAMPAVPSPQADIARRPHSPARPGYGSARQDWGGDGSGLSPTERGDQPMASQLRALQHLKSGRSELQPEAEQSGGPRLGRRRALLIGGAAVAVVAVGGLAAAADKLKLHSAPIKAPTVGFAPATASGASAATQTGTAFLSAWQNNELEVAANITDDPKAALAALEMYRKNLGVLGMVMNPDAANGVGWMTFGITTQGGSPMGQWQYEGAFGTYSKEVDGFVRWFVKWDPSILYTSLEQGYELKIQHTPASVKGLVDRHGVLIDPTEHPSLAIIVETLTSKAKAVGATDGQDIIMVDAEGIQLATVTTLTPPIDNGTVETTLDMKIQSAMESAVTAANAAMVAIEPSTGYILGITNHTSEYYDEALLAGRAPGSTFKIITSTALLHNGLTTIDTNVVCLPHLDVLGTILKNSENESAYGSTYEEDFAASCNNAFSSFWDRGVTPNMLADTAETFYGLNQTWDIGFGEQVQYMTVPGDLTDALLAESLVGQGNILSCPMAMCSVAATVANGSFKQPILLPGTKQITATPLGTTLQRNLKALMSSVVSEGTAAGILPANGHFFAKTGTAETGPQDDVKNDSWFVAFHDEADICLGALAVDGGYGAAVAAPECAKVFEALGYA